MSYQYSTLPQNISGDANIPISNIPVPIASLTITPDAGNKLATLRANVGWQSLSPTAVPVRVLFKIWRGAPITGELVCSALDSAEAEHDEDAVTDFSSVVSGLVLAQPVTFVLTAETVETNTLARVIGPVTFIVYGTDLSIIRYFALPDNTAGGANIPIAQAPMPLASINVDVQPGQDVALRFAAGWWGTDELYPQVDMLFKLWRGAPVTGTLIASAIDSADREELAVTSFSHVDTDFTEAETITYVLTAEAPIKNYSATIVGPVTLTSSIRSITAFFTLPQNTAGAANIPITAAVTPLATLTLQTSPGINVFVRGAIGWTTSPIPSSTSTLILFKIWRGAPNTGTLIYSATDSGEGNFDSRKVTALSHVDSGFTTSGQTTYTLTAQLLNPGTFANVVGPLTFTTNN